jgi:hypothetical protein
MKYLLPCKCGLSVEVEPGQAGQIVVCPCGENLTVPSMLQMKALPEAPEKPIPPRTKRRMFRKAERWMHAAPLICLVIALLLWRLEHGLWCVILFGLTGAFARTLLALFIRQWAKSPLTEDTALRRTFFVLGTALLFPACPLATYLYEYPPQPRYVSLKPVEFSFGTYKRLLYQNSTPIHPSEHTILWMQDEIIDYMFPMELYLYFQTLENPTFSYNFQDNYEALKDTHRIWITVDIILFIISIACVVVSFFMPKQTVVVTGWSGSEWS